MIIIIYLRSEMTRYNVCKKILYAYINIYIYLPKVKLYYWYIHGSYIEVWIACGDSLQTITANLWYAVYIMLLVATPPVCMPHCSDVALSCTVTWLLCTKWAGLASIDKTSVTIIQTFDYVLLWLQLVHIPCWDTGWLVMYLNTISLSAISIDNVGMTVYTMLKHIYNSLLHDFTIHIYCHNVLG